MGRPAAFKKHYFAWVIVVGLAIAGVLVYMLVYIPEEVYRGSLELICVPNYTHGFLLYTRPAESLTATLDCSGGDALVNLTFVGGVNRTIQLSCSRSASIEITSGGVTFVYARVSSCEGGSRIWVKVER